MAWFPDKGSLRVQRYLLAVGLLSALPAYAAPQSHTFNVSVTIEDRFADRYLFKGIGGSDAIANGTISLDAGKRLTTLSGVPFTLWKQGASGGELTQVTGFNMSWQQAPDVTYRQDDLQEPVSTPVTVRVDGTVTPQSGSFAVTTATGGYSTVTVSSEAPFPPSEHGYNQITVRMVALFVNEIE